MVGYAPGAGIAHTFAMRKDEGTAPRWLWLFAQPKPANMMTPPSFAGLISRASLSRADLILSKERDVRLALSCWYQLLGDVLPVSGHGRSFRPAATRAMGAAGAVAIAEHDVQMLCQSAPGSMVFVPAVIEAEPGVRSPFPRPTRAAASRRERVCRPQVWMSSKARSTEEYILAVSEAGIHDIECPAPVAVGMGALVQVGKAPANLEEAREATLPKKAAERMERSFLSELPPFDAPSGDLSVAGVPLVRGIRL